jgi:outer membrane murein-binding lipoprotein Lpp
MQNAILRKVPLAILLLSPVALAGCASEGSVDRANNEASSAMSAADQSKSEADKAMATAQQALKMAQDANAAAQKANTDASKMYQRSLQK